MSGVRRAARQRSARYGREARIDPVCHTLVGAALSRSGLGKRTALGATALIIGANLPDLDVLAYFAGPQADLQWRRGWTHGILALVVLPFLLTGSLLLLHRASERLRRARSAALLPRQLLFLSCVAILSHPILDTLNTYGMRWLMPFSGTWLYGDTLFIIDPWMWLALTLGIYYSRRRQTAGRPYPTRPARVALAAIALYATAMTVSGRAAQGIIAREITALSGRPVHATMAGPVPLDPLVRRFVVEQDKEYRVGTFRWLEQPHVSRSDLQTFPRDRPPHRALDVAVNTLPARRFLGWARFPTFEIDPTGAGEYMVHIIDLRYARGPGDSFGALSVPVTLDSTFASRGSRSSFF